MSSLLDERPAVLGIQQPRVSAWPGYVSTAGPEAVELAFMAGLELDEWQQLILRHALGERPDGRWSAFEVGVMVSRQNGKGGLLEARELAGLFVLHERLITHTAHLFDTSIEHFARLLGLIEDTPELSKRIKPRGVSRSHGQEGITLKDGCRIRFRTRTKGGGRGFTGDCVVLDEAMEISEAAHGALIPSVSARTILSETGPQIWYTGSAVDQQEMDNGVVFARIRERGHAGDDPSLAYFEWSAGDSVDGLTVNQADDRDAWAQANPALGVRISVDHVAKERASLSTRKFAVERLGMGDWPATDDLANRVITLQAWRACLDAESAAEDPVVFAFDVTPDRSSAAIAAAGDRADGNTHVEVVEHQRGTSWIARRLGELVAAHKTWRVFYDPAGPAGSLAAEVEAEVGTDRKRESLAVAVSAKEHAQACGLFFDAVADRRLHHLGTDELDAAVDGARARPLGEAWAWSRKNSTIDISPLVASTLAVWGNRQRPPVPKPRAVNLAAALARAAAPGGADASRT